MKKELIIPTQLKDISLDSYQRFLTTVENSDEQFIREKMIQIFCGIELKYINHIPAKEFIEITNTITGVLNEVPELTTTFTHRGIQYGFIPNMDKMTLGEFIDLDTYISDWQKMELVMNVLYRPITEKKGDKYRIEPYKGEPNPAFKDLPLDIVIGAMLFFWIIANELLNYIQNYIPQVVQSKKVQRILMKNGGGIYQFQNSLEMTITELKKSLNQTFIMPSFIYVT